MKSGVVKKLNNYVTAIDGIYANTPKAVLAAIAVSLATCGGEHIDEAENQLLKEWRILHDNGIIPQSPVREPNFGNDGRES